MGFLLRGARDCVMMLGQPVGGGWITVPGER